MSASALSRLSRSSGVVDYGVEYQNIAVVSCMCESFTKHKVPCCIKIERVWRQCGKERTLNRQIGNCAKCECPYVRVFYEYLCISTVNI